jgi:hypothetical protein
MGLSTPSALDLASLVRQVAAVGAENAHRWQLAHIPGSLRVYATLTPAGYADVYCIRLDFGDSLSAGPPSAAFCDPVTQVEGAPRDWPRGLDHYFKLPPNNGASGWICNPWTHEGRAHHAEWRDRGWPVGRGLWTVISAIQDILDAPGMYQGRTS